MVWYFHLFQTFLQFVVIHTVKGFGIVNKAEIDGFLELSCFFDDPEDVGNLISISPAFSKTSLNIRSSREPLNFSPHAMNAFYPALSRESPMALMVGSFHGKFSSGQNQP